MPGLELKEMSKRHVPRMAVLACGPGADEKAPDQILIVGHAFLQYKRYLIRGQASI